MINIIKAFIVLVPFFSDYDHLIVHCQLINHAPYFVPGSGDMSRFSLPENTPVDSPVYQLKGKFWTQQKRQFILHSKFGETSSSFVW